jgi:pimeloyl-ACP methyl ester carboxylesterase
VLAFLSLVCASGFGMTPCDLETENGEVEVIEWPNNPVGVSLCTSIITPSGLDGPSKAVLMLHGLGDSPNSWGREGVVELWLSAMDSGDIPPMRIILIQGNKGYWSNQISGTEQYRDWVLWAMTQLIQTNEIQGSGHHILGVSMGGFGALSIGLSAPHLFSSISALSPTDLSIATKATPKNSVYTHVFGAPIVRPYLAALDPRELLLRGEGHSQSISIVVGSEEPPKFLRGVQRIEALLPEYSLDLEVKKVEGGCHCWQNTWSAPSNQWLIGRLSDSLEQ